jgi:hypothetical protein
MLGQYLWTKLQVLLGRSMPGSRSRNIYIEVLEKGCEMNRLSSLMSER